MTSMEELEQTYLQQVMMHSGADVDLVDASTLHINHGLALLTGREQTDENHYARLLLFARAFNSLVGTRKALFTGYTVEALLLTRSAMEDWGSAKYIQHHPDEASLWLQPSADWTGPSFSKIWEDAPDEGDDAKKEDTTAKLRLIYGHLSLFAHPRAVGLRHLISYDGGEAFIQAGPPREWDASRFELGLYFMLYVVQGFFAAVDRLIVDNTGSPEISWRVQALELTEQIRMRVAAIRDGVNRRIEEATTGAS